MNITFFRDPTYGTTMLTDPPIPKLSGALILLILQNPVSSSTIPCPGFENPSNFTSIPLSQRPKLAKILQHGWNPSLLQATPPSRIELPHVATHLGFVDRPYRKLVEDDSQCNYATSDSIRCVRSGRLSIGQGPGSSLTEKQVLLELGLGFGASYNFRAGTIVNETSFVPWANAVEDFLQEHDATCDRTSSYWLVARSFSCVTALTDCRVLDDEFKADLATLPTSANNSQTNVGNQTELLARYQDFVDKWGHGVVDKFKFGMVEWTELLSTSDGDADPVPRLYMGRAGGTGEIEQGDYYTEQECLDPAPIELNYRTWGDVLGDILLFDRFQDPLIQTIDVDAIISSFQELSSTYPSLSQQIREIGLDNIKCPSPPSNTEPPSFAPTSAGADGNLPTLSPSILSAEETSQPTNEEEPTDQPTATSGGQDLIRSEITSLVSLVAISVPFVIFD